jgi:RimJ/RimL family protein N-acetyltransferase
MRYDESMLAGETIVLRPPLPDDRDLLFRVRNDASEQTALMSLPRANSARRVDDWVEGILDDPQSLFFVIADRQTNRAVGFVQMRRIDFVHGTGELGIWLDEPARGAGSADQALQLLEAHARDVFRVRKVVLQVLADNQRAVRCYERNGYAIAGTLREHFYHGGRYHDVLIMEHLLEKTGR